MVAARTSNSVNRPGDFSNYETPPSRAGVGVLYSDRMPYRGFVDYPRRLSVARLLAVPKTTFREHQKSLKRTSEENRDYVTTVNSFERIYREHFSFSGLLY